jgi:hypothetical protein
LGFGLQVVAHDRTMLRARERDRAVARIRRALH